MKTTRFNSLHKENIYKGINGRFCKIEEITI